MAEHDSVRVLVLVSLLLILDHACLCLCRNRSPSSICFEDERDALLQLKQSLSYISHILYSWNSEDCCQWTGVKCDRANGHVVMLKITPEYKFPFRHISFTTSELNSSLLNLRYLSYLELSRIYFKKANILNDIGSMKQLRYLNLSNSFGFATFPSEWGNLTQLEVLDLHSYYHVGAVDDIQWVSHLQALKYLDMSGLNFTKYGDPIRVINILPSLSHLSLSYCGVYDFHLPTHLDLQYLDLSENFFQVPISSMIFQNMISLLYLDLSWNSFKGPIPSTIFENMTSLQHLNLSGNLFNSSIPRGFDNLRSLVNLNLEDNLLQSIEGGLLCFLRNKPFLESLSLTNNKLHDELFSVEGNSLGLIGKNLALLAMSKNFLQGALPDWLVHLKNLTMLYLGNNQLTGNILEALGRLQGLSSLDLNKSFLNGTIPHSVRQLQDLYYLDLSANSSRGTIFKIHFSNLLKLSYLDISNNYFAFKVDSDWIPPFNLRYIEMMSCKFGTKFPQCIRTQAKAIEIDLSNASITGALPDWLGLISFSYLNLAYNQINGSLPKFPSNLSWLDLSCNLILGPILQDIGLEKPYMTFFYLNDNLLSGSIPISLCEMELEALHLGRNGLIGKIPACWKDNGMSLLDLSSNKLSGVILSSLGNFIRLLLLHLNKNSLHGEIPVTMNNCKDLLILDLGENKIFGTVLH